MTPPSISFSAMSAALRASASVNMERNFHMVNSVPQRPTRICLKNTGPGSSSRMSTATTRTTGASTTKSTAEAPMSSSRPSR